MDMLAWLGRKPDVQLSDCLMHKSGKLHHQMLFKSVKCLADSLEGYNAGDGADEEAALPACVS